MWILIRWLHQKPADLDIQWFQNRINLGFSKERVKIKMMMPFYFHNYQSKRLLLVLKGIHLNLMIRQSSQHPLYKLFHKEFTLYGHSSNHSHVTIVICQDLVPCSNFLIPSFWVDGKISQI